MLLVWRGAALLRQSPSSAGSNPLDLTAVSAACVINSGEMERRMAERVMEQQHYQLQEMQRQHHTMEGKYITAL